MVNKRGDMLTPAQLVIIILAVIGMVMGIFILFSLNLKGEADDKACSLSVLSRAGTSSVLPSATQSYIPLKCTTKKICFTTPGGKCSEFAGEQGVVNIVIPKDNALKAAAIIENTTVKSMYDCWNLMGQGKLDIFPGTSPSTDSGWFDIVFDSLKSTRPTCFICYKIAMSESFKNDETYYKLVNSQVDIDGYAESNRPEGSQKTYVEIFTDEKVRSYSSNFIKTKGLPKVSALIFSQIITRGDPVSSFGSAASTASISFLTGNIAFKLTKVVSLKFQLAAILLYGTLAAGKQVENQGVSAARCGDLTANKQTARQGCSILGRYDYNDVNKINTECEYIEGNP